MNCNGCSCVANYNDDTEFCGRLIVSGERDGKGRKSTSVMGCNKSCPQCKDCNYPPPPTNNRSGSANNRNGSANNRNGSANNRNGSSNRNNASNSNQSKNSNKSKNSNASPLTKKAFLEFLKRQRELNKKEGLVPEGVVRQDNNADADFNENLNLSNNVQRNTNDIRRRNRRVVEQARNMNMIQSNNVEEEEPEMTCSQLSKEECSSDHGCEWDNENVMCKSLDVTFYSQEGENGSFFKVPIGNYDNNDISSFEFKPEFMAIPLGLRVKIWNKPGFVGPVNGFLGNNNPAMANVKKNLYPVTELGSLQICNMKTCVKPSQFEDMQLISVIDGNNIDFVENNVRDLGEYKEKLREKIHRKLLDVRFTHKDCLEHVANFLQSKKIDISSDLSEIENSFVLQKVLYELDNLPSCEKLLQNHVEVNQNVPVESELLTPIETLIENSLNENSPSISEDTFDKIEEQGNINSIIFIFVFLLIILLMAALIYIYMMHNSV